MPTARWTDGPWAKEFALHGKGRGGTGNCPWKPIIRIRGRGIHPTAAKAAPGTRESEVDGPRTCAIGDMVRNPS